MASITCSMAVAAPRAVCSKQGSLRPVAFSKPAFGAPLMAARKPAVAERRSTAVQAFSGMEVAQIAGEAGFIGGVAGVMVAITLVGLSFGFIILRVESLVEEGKL